MGNNRHARYDSHTFEIANRLHSLAIIMKENEIDSEFVCESLQRVCERFDIDKEDLFGVGGAFTNFPNNFLIQFGGLEEKIRFIQASDRENKELTEFLDGILIEIYKQCLSLRREGKIQVPDYKNTGM